MNNDLKTFLKKHAIEYKEILSDKLNLSKSTGSMILIPYYYPNDDDSKPIYIFLSFESDNKFENKCWLSCKIENQDSSKPKYHIEYEEFSYDKVLYYPYSIQINDKEPLNNIISILNGLHEFCNE